MSIKNSVLIGMLFMVLSTVGEVSLASSGIHPFNLHGSRGQKFLNIIHVGLPIHVGLRR